MKFASLQIIWFCLAATPKLVTAKRQLLRETSGAQSSSKTSASDIINQLFSANYDSKVRPGYHGNRNGHLNVTVWLYTLPWFEVDELKMEYSLTIILIQTWTDERLSFNNESVQNIVLNGEHMKKVWIPDTYITHERKSHLHDVTHPNEFIRIQSDGQVTLETRSSVTLACTSHYLNSEDFPFDSHHCRINLESFKERDGEIMYHWHWWDSGLEVGETQLNFPSRCTGYLVRKITEYQEFISADVDEMDDSEDEEGSSKGEVATAGLIVEIVFERTLQQYITSVYIPLIIFTSVSILSLGVLNVKVSSFLNFFNIGFINIFMALRFNSQDMIWATKTTALDKYLHICNLFIICCALVNIYLIYMETSKRNNEENIELRDVQPSVENENHLQSPNRNSRRSSDHENLFGPLPETRASHNNVLLTRFRSLMEKVPEGILLFCEFSSWTFAGAFVVANAFYWAKYLQHFSSHK